MRRSVLQVGKKALTCRFSNASIRKNTAAIVSAPIFQQQNQRRQYHNSNKSSHVNKFTASTMATIGAALAAWLFYQHQQSKLTLSEEKEEDEVAIIPGEYKAGLQDYTRAEIAQHKTKQSRIWVSYKVFF